MKSLAAPGLLKRIQGNPGKRKLHPATTIAKDALASMLRAPALFGFDPSSRSRLSVGDNRKQTEGPEKGVEPGPGVSDPALASTLQEINGRLDALTATVQKQRAAIPPEERPAVGEVALQHSTKKLSE